MTRIEIKSPCKINFGLNIVSKRSDGFHNIETIFYPINLFDVIVFEISNNFSFSCNIESLEENNIITKAVRLIEEEKKIKLPVAIHLEKRIPFGAGLGGGSSNAASTLLSLNELFQLNMSNEIVKSNALKLGSDVPFFLKPFPSFGKSRGEVLTEINFVIKKPLLIINPGINVATKWAYENIIPRRPDFNLIELNNNGFSDYSQLNHLVVNDFENIVFSKFPEIKNIKNEIQNFGAEFSLMSGSGSSVFGIFNDVEKAEIAQDYFSQKYFTHLELYEN